MENKIVKGCKIKLPSCEYNYHKDLVLNETTAIEEALRINQDFLYVVNIKEDGEVHVGTLINDWQSSFHIDDLELYEEESKVIVINPTNKVIAEDLHDYLWNIKSKDIEFFNELAKLIGYLSSTYADKYEGESSNYAKDKLLSKEGKAANIFTALKYIKRYDTVGYSKSENPQDILKSIHYLLFENQRKNKHGV